MKPQIYIKRAVDGSNEFALICKWSDGVKSLALWGGDYRGAVARMHHLNAATGVDWVVEYDLMAEPQSIEFYEKHRARFGL